MQRKYITRLPVFVILFLMIQTLLAQDKSSKFPWPEGKKMALSLSFDDARTSNPTLGTGLLDKYGVKATFFVVPSNVRKDLENWKKATAAGHEMANHSVNHPCSGNFVWSRDKSLDNYTVAEMRKELEQANAEIADLLGVTPRVYAYPCGQTYLGKGANAQSFIPLISEMFLAGRGWLDEAPVDPVYGDMAHLTGMKMDNTDFDEILPIIESAADNGQWLVLAGHETNNSGNQTTYLTMLEKLSQYATDPKNGIWIAPIGTVAEYVNEKREGMTDSLNIPGTVRSSPDGQFRLTAEKGQAIGPNIKYMPEWKAFGWFMGKDHVEWEAEVDQPGSYNVILEWSVSDEEAGKEYIFQTGSQRLKGKIGKTGSWETFKQESLGTIKLQKGRHKMIFKAAELDAGPLLDLRNIALVPIE